MTVERSTPAGTVEFEGLGLHSGVPVTVRVHPGEEGIRFRYAGSTWAVTPANVTDTSRCTRLGEISTIEHLMSAFAGLEITDAEVEVSAPELPALDGSSAVYYEQLKAAGLEALGPVEVALPFARVFVRQGDAQIAVSAGEGHWRYEFTTGDRWPKEQIFETANVTGGYEAEIAGARTFGFEEELPMIRAAGLAKGLDASSALVLGQSGYLNEARWPDEPVRHKLLDAIGDIYLAGIPIRLLNVAAIRTGHTATVEAAQKLREASGL